ncbi:MAG TPA: type VI secretion system baseplate subunit TssF [Kofleriaceae bacterium]|nr:type VI secretion system baseplate subunit TssF [Kofleriaceae bacterium]
MEEATSIGPALFEDYQRELESLETFRERYRHLYPFAGLDRDDPDVQRLLEGLAFFTARTRRAGEHALAAYERRALEQVFPHLCTPLPSMALLAVEGAERMVEARSLPAGTEVAVSPRAAVRLRGDEAPAVFYRTTRDLVVRPFDLDRARIELSRLGDDGWELVVPIRSATPRVEAVELIELHIDPHGDLLAALRLHHALSLHLEGVRYAFPGTRQPERSARRASFAPAPGDADPFAGPLERFREVMHFPQGALVVRVAIEQTPAEWQRLELRFRLGPGWPRELGVPPGAFLLHAAPLINLRRELADPAPLDGTKARILVAHPEPALELRPRELLAVYRSSATGLTPLLPESLAGGDGEWYAAETTGRHTGRQVWLDVHAPDAFEARAAAVVDAEWYQPGAGQLLRGPLEARLTARHLEGPRWRVVTPVEDAVESPLAGRRERLSRLLALAGQADLDASALTFLLEMLGAAERELFQRVARAIAEVKTDRQPDARSPSGVRTTVEVRIRRLPLALVPAADLVLSRLPALLAAWTGDEPPIVRVRLEGDEEETVTTYRDEESTRE